MNTQNRIERKFAELKSKGQKALITYICAGDPDLALTEELVAAMADSGADIIELGVPYSDPIADGPVIQAAGQRALLNGVKTERIFTTVESIRTKREVPLILMVYFNCILQYGVTEFVQRCATAGVDGMIVPDLPLEESDELMAAAEKAGVDLILLVAPTSPPERIRNIAKGTKGFLYCVSVTGVTGTRTSFSDDLAGFLQLVRREAGSEVPLAVGFGISNSKQAADIAAMADGAIVGSAVIKVMEQQLGKPDMVKQVGSFVEQLNQAVKR